MPWRPIGWFTVIGFACVLSAALWPIIAAIVTGQPTALFETQASWPRPGNADPSIPFSVWIATRGGVVIGLATLAALLAIFAVAFRINRLRPFGPEIYAWTLAYITFLFATIGSSPSTPRFFLPALSIHLFLAVFVRRWWQSLVLLALLLAGQFYWILRCYTDFNFRP